MNDRSRAGTTEQSFFSGQPFDHCDSIHIVYGDNTVANLAMKGLRHEAYADALHLGTFPGGPRLQDRALRLYGNNR